MHKRALFQPMYHNAYCSNVLKAMRTWLHELIPSIGTWWSHCQCRTSTYFRNEFHPWIHLLNVDTLKVSVVRNTKNIWTEFQHLKSGKNKEEAFIYTQDISAVTLTEWCPTRARCQTTPSAPSSFSFIHYEFKLISYIISLWNIKFWQIHFL